MRYTQQVSQQLSNDLKVEFGKELGFTQPLSQESDIPKEERRVPIERSMEIARKMKKTRQKNKHM